MNSFTIKAKLPSLNEYTRACRTHRMIGAKFKEEVEEVIGWYIKQAQTAGTLSAIEKPCEIYIDFYEKTKRRDVDNIISGGTKFILDALVQNKIIPNDNRKYVKQVRCSVYDDTKDYIVVRLIEYSKSIPNWE